GIDCRVPGHRGGQRRAAGDPRGPRRWAGGPAVDRGRLLADAGFADVDRGLAVGPLWPQARVRGRPGWLRRSVGAVHAGAHHVLADRRACPAGRGRRAPEIRFSLVGGLVALAVFLAHERRARHPMLDLALFRHRNFAAGNLATVAIYAGLSASSFLIPVFLQQVAKYAATTSGLA